MGAPSTETKRALKRIHTETVREIVDMDPNKVLGACAPEIDTSDKSLDRRTRTRLSQLRSGYSMGLESHKFRIGLSERDRCPKCKIEPRPLTTSSTAVTTQLV